MKRLEHVECPHCGADYSILHSAANGETVECGLCHRRLDALPVQHSVAGGGVLTS